MTAPSLQPCRYRILPGEIGDRAAPARGVRPLLNEAVAVALGRTGLFAGAFVRAQERLISDPTAPSVRFAFAEAHFGRGLLVQVDPARLRAYLPDLVTDGRRAVRLARWFLDGCDWSDAILPLAGSEVDTEVAALFEHDGRLPHSPAYQALAERMRAGRPDVRNGVVLDSLDRIDSYFAHYGRLRDSIAAHGLKARDEVPGSVRALARAPMRGRGAERREREIGLAIDGSGALIRTVGGRHRTAIAQRLGLPRAPAQIRLVHVGWLAKRMAATGLRADRALLEGVRHVEGLR